MGLAASQTRYLSLTARKSDLEHQAQQINSMRLQLADQSAAASKAYAEGMNNKIIKVSSSVPSNDPNKIGEKVWSNLNYENLVSSGYQVIGANGTQLNPSPYTEYISGSIISAMDFEFLTKSEQDNCTRNADGTYTVDKSMRKEAKADFNGMDIQTLLVSGQGQIVSQQFFNYLCSHGYGSGQYFSTDANGNKVEVSYADLVDDWQANKGGCNPSNAATVIDWRADVTSTFKEVFYTEDDAQVYANYEAKTAEIQSQDKMLEAQLKNIETQHKAIETEMESVKKVIDKNIETSYKSFA